MTLTDDFVETGFHPALIARDRAPEIPEAVDAYGWLVGSWELEVRRYREDVTGLGLKGEAHFARTLEGRAIQDLWIMPRRSERSAELPQSRNMFGTTLRVWDAAMGAWRVTWINPVTGQRDELIGRRCGEAIVQIGRHSDGTPIRWSFRDITPDSFRWVGEVLEPDGETWRVEAEFLAQRCKGEQR
jgi:hypothetical protein